MVVRFGGKGGEAKARRMGTGGDSIPSDRSALTTAGSFFCDDRFLDGVRLVDDDVGFEGVFFAEDCLLAKGSTENWVRRRR
jgi:hypothetical protein